jgi:hypothetical protein
VAAATIKHMFNHLWNLCSVNAKRLNPVEFMFVHLGQKALAIHPAAPPERRKCNENEKRAERLLAFLCLHLLQ